MLRTTAIAKELAAIERKMQETDNATLKEALKKKQARLKAELKDPGQSATKLAKTLLAQREVVKQLSKVEFNDLIRRLSKKPEYAFLKTMPKSTVKNDLEVTAKPVGWRFKGRGNYDKPTKAEIIKGKKNGTVYREVRPRRSDVSQVVKLGHGGDVDFSPVAVKNANLEELFEMADKLGMNNYQNLNKEVLRNRILEHFKLNRFKGKMSDGGSMYAEGGGVSEKYCVVMSGGSIGEKGIFDKKGRKLVDTFDTREEAATYAKRRNSQLSPGEKSYYKMKFYIAPYNEKDFISKMSNGGSMYADGGGVEKSDLEYSLRMILDEKGLNPIAVKSVKKSGKTFTIVVSSYITANDLVTELNSLLKTSFEIIDGSMTKSVTGNKIFKIKESKMSDGGSMYAGGGIDSIEPTGYKQNDAVEYGKKLIDAGVKYSIVRSKIEEHYAGLTGEIQDVMNKVLDYKESKMKQGGSLEKESVEMINNQATSAKHHIEELKQVLSHQKEIEPWVIAKMQRATTDLSDITHYLDGKDPKMAFGGIVYDLSNDAIDRMDGLAPIDAMQVLNNNILEISKSLEEEGFEKDEIASYLSYKIVEHLNKMMALGGKIGSTVVFKNFQGDIKEGEIIDFVGNRGYEVRSGYGTAFVKPDEVITVKDKMAKGGEIEVGDWVKEKKGTARGKVWEKDGIFIKLEDKYGGKSNTMYRIDQFGHSTKPRYDKGGAADGGSMYAEGGSIEVGDKVKATKEYGGKSGTVIEKRGSFVVVEDSKGNTESYHESDLVKKMAQGGQLTAAQQKKFDQVMHEWGEGKLHSGSEDGPIVKDQDQAIAIAYAEARGMKKMSKGGAADGGGNNNKSYLSNPSFRSELKAFEENPEKVTTAIAIDKKHRNIVSIISYDKTTDKEAVKSLISSMIYNGVPNRKFSSPKELTESFNYLVLNNKDQFDYFIKTYNALEEILTGENYYKRGIALDLYEDQIWWLSKPYNSKTDNYFNTPNLERKPRFMSKGGAADGGDLDNLNIGDIVKVTLPNGFRGIVRIEPNDKKDGRFMGVPLRSTYKEKNDPSYLNSRQYFTKENIEIIKDDFSNISHNDQEQLKRYRSSNYSKGGMADCGWKHKTK